jgi:hypothetical protein
LHLSPFLRCAVLTSRPHLHPKVPRLFPHVPNPSPAIFVEAREVRLGDGLGYVAYEWLPGDYVGPVFLAFPIDDSAGALNLRRAAQLYEKLGTTVAIPTGDDNLVRQELDTQPALFVVDGRKPLQAPTYGAEIYGWLDLANLLRVDLPWWPFALRHREAMLAWYPGAQPTSVEPFHRRLRSTPAARYRQQQHANHRAGGD